MDLHVLISCFLIGQLSQLMMAFTTTPAPVNSTLEEHCQWEDFEATCGADEVILMQSSIYGRLQTSKCEQSELFMDCTVDVLQQTRALCSGRHRCVIKAPFPAFHQIVPCPKDMFASFTTSYRCVKVATSEVDMPCVHGNEYPAYGPSGYLASTITESQHIGGERCPWTISVQQGQRVNLTLMNFSVPEMEDSNSLRCPVYARITDGALEREITGCTRWDSSGFYESKNSELLVQIVQTSTPNHTVNFLIKYQAIGCPDIEAPPLAYVTRDHVQAVIRCNHTSQTWHLVCRDTIWVGEVSNCSDAYGAAGVGSNNGFLPPYGLVAAIVIGIILGIFIGLCLLGFVLLCKRYKKKKNSSHFPQTVLYKDQAHIIRQPQGGDYGYSHVWELQQQQSQQQQQTTISSPAGSPCTSTMCSHKLSAGGCGTAGEHLAMTVKGGGLLNPARGQKDHIYESPKFDKLPDAIPTSCAAGDLIPTPEFQQPMCAAHPQMPQLQSACETQNIQNEATLSRGTIKKQIAKTPQKDSCRHVDERIEGLKGDYIPPTEASSEDSDDACTDPLTGTRAALHTQGKATPKGYRPIPVNSPVVPTSGRKSKPAPPVRSVSNAERKKLKI